MMNRLVLGALVVAFAIPTALSQETISAPETRVIELETKLHRKWPFQFDSETWLSVGTTLPLARAIGRDVATSLEGTALLVDADGDDKPELRIEGPQGFCVLKGTDGRRYGLRLALKGKWFYAPGSSMQGKIGKVKVRVVDQNANGKFDDIGEDAFFVGNTKRGLPLGSVAHIGEHGLQVLNVSEDGRRLSFQAFTGPTGELRLDLTTKAKVLSAIIQSKDKAMSFDLTSNRGEAVKLPAGDYRLRSGEIGLAKSRVTLRSGRADNILIAPKSKTNLPLGQPLRAEFGVQRAGREIQFSPQDIRYFGRGGEEYVGWTPIGKSPKINVKTPSGRQLIEAYFAGS